MRRIQVPIPKKDYKEIIKRSLEQMFINLSWCEDEQGKLLKISSEDIWKEIRACLSKKPEIL